MIQKKKEHLQLDEANSNNELINDFGDCFLESMKSFFKRIRDNLGYDIEIEAIARPVESEHTEEDYEEESESDEQ